MPRDWPDRGMVKVAFQLSGNRPAPSAFACWQSARLRAERSTTCSSSNRMGCLGSIVASIILTAVLSAILACFDVHQDVNGGAPCRCCCPGGSAGLAVSFSGSHRHVRKRSPIMRRLRQLLSVSSWSPPLKREVKHSG